MQWRRTACLFSVIATFSLLCLGVITAADAPMEWLNAVNAKLDSIQTAIAGVGQGMTAVGEELREVRKSYEERLQALKDSSEKERRRILDDLHGLQKRYDEVTGEYEKKLRVTQEGLEAEKKAFERLMK
jgi:hypothetical protein